MSDNLRKGSHVMLVIKEFSYPAFIKKISSKKFLLYLKVILLPIGFYANLGYDIEIEEISSLPLVATYVPLKKNPSRNSRITS